MGPALPYPVDREQVTAIPVGASVLCGGISTGLGPHAEERLQRQRWEGELPHWTLWMLGPGGDGDQQPVCTVPALSPKGAGAHSCC